MSSYIEQLDIDTFYKRLDRLGKDADKLGLHKSGKLLRDVYDRVKRERLKIRKAPCVDPNLGYTTTMTTNTKQPQSPRWIGLTPAANEIADRVAVFLHSETQNVDHKTVQMTDVLTGFLGPLLMYIDFPWEKPTSLSVLEGVIRMVISDVPNWRFPDDDGHGCD